MKHEIWIALIAGFSGMFGWGLADFFAKKTIDKVGDIVSLFWGHLFGTLVLFLVFLYECINGKFTTFPHDIKTILYLLLFGIAQAIIYLLVYRGFGKGQLAVLNPIFASFTGITALLSILFFGEVLHTSTLVSSGVIFLGIILITIDISALRLNKFNFIKVHGFKEIIIATFMASFWTLFWDIFVGGNNWLFYAMCMYAFMTLAIYLISKFKKTSLRVEISNTWIFLILIGLCEAIAYLGISFGYSKTSLTSIIALISGAFSLPTILLAKIFLKEKVSTIQTIGSIIIMVGIVIILML